MNRRAVFTSLVLLVLLGCSRGVQPRATTSTTEAVEKLSPVAVIVTARRVTLHEQALLTSKVVKVADQGDLLKLSDEQESGPWYRVELDKAGQSAWIHEDGISVLYRKDATRPASVPGERSYINVDGERVPAPVKSDSKPEGATARCRDGTYSFSRHRSGTCSRHGGVSVWY